MSLYFVGIDISKYKHDCCIISAANHLIAYSNCNWHIIINVFYPNLFRV